MKKIFTATLKMQNLMEKLHVPKERILKKMKDKTVVKFTGKNTMQEKGNKSFAILVFRKMPSDDSPGLFYALHSPNPCRITVHSSVVQSITVDGIMPPIPP